MNTYLALTRVSPELFRISYRRNTYWVGRRPTIGILHAKGNISPVGLMPASIKLDTDSYVAAKIFKTIYSHWGRS